MEATMSRDDPAPRPKHAGFDPGGTGGPAVGTALGRRQICKGAVGAAAAGTAGATVRTGATPALAAGGRTALARRARGILAAATTVEQTAVAPAVVGLTDAATIAVDASLGNDLRVTIAGNRTIANPSNPAPGQQIIFQVTQGPGGGFSVSWGSAYEFSDGLPQPVLSSGAGQTDLLGFIYNAAKGKWLFAAFLNG